MKRRDFLKTSAVVYAIASAQPWLSSFSSAENVDPLKLEETTILQLQDRMNSGEITARSLTEAYLSRIDKIDKQINSVIEKNSEAVDIAEQLDRERKEKGPRGPLHGIPILIKDNIDTADRMKTTAGSLAMLESKPLHDAFVAQKLREAGAVILGKTNLSEWANFRSNFSTSGWSARGGQTKNPYVLDRNPCGSSSGSGAAAAANLCAAAIGTETDGSIVCPSSICSLVGIKPTLGLVSRAGIIPVAHSQDTAGPMARNVTDAAIILGALTGIDPRDPATNESKGKLLTDYTRFLDPDGLRGARIGVNRTVFGSNEKVDELINDSIKVLQERGAIIVDPANLTFPQDLYEMENLVLLYEFKADLNNYLSSLGPAAPMHSLKEIIDFNEKNRDKEMPYFGQDVFLKAEEKGPLTSKEYLDAVKKYKEIAGKKGIDEVIEHNKLDAIIAPTRTLAWLVDYINGDCFGSGYSSGSAISGYPHITVPAGYVSGLPVGLSFFASAYSEPTLIKLAYSFEQATKARRAPEFLPSVKIAAGTESANQNVKKLLV
jgi:amidase